MAGVGRDISSSSLIGLDEASSGFFMTNEVASRVPWSLRLLYPLIQMSMGSLMVTLAVDLSVLANNCGVSTSTASWALVLQGLGILFSMVFVYKYSSMFFAHDTIPIGLVLSAIFTMCVPYVTSIYLLCALTFLLGFLDNVIASISFNLVRLLFGPYAGPWCTFTQLCYVFGGVIGTILNIVSYLMSPEGDDDDACINCSPWYFIVLGSSMLLLAISMYFITDPERDKPSVFYSSFVPFFRPEDEHEEEDNQASNNTGATGDNIHRSGSRSDDCIRSDHDENDTLSVTSSKTGTSLTSRADISQVPHYRVEIALFFVQLFVTGSEYILISYLTSFANETGIESYNSAYYQATFAWFLDFIGMFYGMIDQSHAPTPEIEEQLRAAHGRKRLFPKWYWYCPFLLPVTTETLPWKIISCLVTGSFAMLLFTLPYLRHCNWMFWIATSIFSLSNGPLVGYVLDWLNRTTYATEFATGIALSGVNIGPPAMLLVTLISWYGFDLGMWAVIYCAVTVPLIGVPLIWYSRTMSYRSEVNPKYDSNKDIDRDRYQYMPIA